MLPLPSLLLAAEDATQYRLSGIITRDTGSDYGNIYIKDATGEVYIYGVLTLKENNAMEEHGHQGRGYCYPYYSPPFIQRNPAGRQRHC